MKTLLTILILLCVTASGAGCALLNDQTPAAEHRYEPTNRDHLRSLKQLAASPAVVNYTRVANLLNTQSQDEIDLVDTAWKAQDPAVLPRVDEVLDNSTAVYLRRIQRLFPEYLEIMLIDRKGCVVASADRTSDYWQGDERKWQTIFHNPQREYTVADVHLDLSVNAYLHHYSLPVRDHEGQLIGVLVAGVAFD